MDSAFDLAAQLNMSIGPGALAELPRLLRQFEGRKVGIITDPGCIGAGLLDRIQDAGPEMRDAVVFSDVVSDPKDATVTAATAAMRDAGASVIVALGGGSSIDTAKGAATLATNGGVIADYAGGAYGTDFLRVDPLPVIAIPTTAGTGSEVSGNAAISDSKTGRKMAIRSNRIRPRGQILDPHLLETLPSSVAAHSGLDAVSHALEGYCSKRSNIFTDALAVHALEIMFEWLPVFVGDRANSEAATHMLYGSMVAGIVFSNTGTGNGHAIGRALGGVISVPHGLAVGVVLPHVVEFNRAVCEPKLARLSRKIGASADDGSFVVERLEDLIRAVDVPSRLGELGIQEGDFDGIAEVAVANVGPNPRSTTVDDLKRLLARAL